MGAVNYCTSDYITLGFNLDYDSSDFESFEEMDECIQLDIEEMSNEVERLLNEQNFTFFHVAIKPGYYEGFTLDIENNYGCCLDSWEDRRESQKEITRLKSFLLACCEVGLVQVWPGWCTKYKTHEETITAIIAAVQEMREEVKHTPTWRQYEKGIKHND